MGRYLFDFTPVGGQRAGGGEAAPNATTTPAATTAAGGGGRRGAVPLSFLDTPFVLIINTAPDEYYFAANGSFPFRVSPNNIPGANIAAAASIDRGAFKDGLWVTQRRLNGDDIMRGGYDVSAAASNHQDGTVIPLGPQGRPGGRSAAAAGETPAPPPTVMRIEFYHYH
jgi:hypothetical protein